ncbi:MAG: TolC family protein, partial [Deltaproteobacteria bacterium]
LVYPGAARAQVWTEGRAIARADATAPYVLRARTQVEGAAALGTYGTVPIVGNPIVGVRALFVPDREAATVGLYLGLPFEIGGARAAWRTEARHAFDVAQASLDAARIDARADARRAYVDVAVAAERVRMTGLRLETARELLSRTEARVNAAASTELDRALALREVGIAEFEVASAVRDRDAAAARFRSALDLSPGDPVAAAPVSAPSPEPGLTREAAIARALALRPEPRAGRATEARWLSADQRLRAESIAPIIVAAEAEVTQYRYAGVGVSLNAAIPLWQLAQGPRAVARAEARTAASLRGITERDIAREAGAAWDAYRDALEEHHTLLDHYVPALERTLELTDRLFDAGAVDAFRALLARQELASARLRLLEAVRGAWLARIALDRITAVQP